MVWMLSRRKTTPAGNHNIDNNHTFAHALFVLAAAQLQSLEIKSRLVLLNILDFNLNCGRLLWENLTDYFRLETAPFQ